METTIHPLQNESIKLLRSLYQDLRLPATTAMLSVLNGYYPEINEVLKTLQHYKDQPMVSEFVKNHEPEILSANESLKAVPKSETTPPPTENIFSDFFKSESSLPNAYGALKKVSTERIESALSKALSEICEEEVIVEIYSTQKLEESIYKNAELKLYIKSAKLIRYK
ncbi:hypothetical protein [Cycloclasticus pugetii]|uniref:hypothetical protein n=1 Tax=Cycloclasticus pugetii TaxID=34068 RepID=UPI003A947B57